MISYFQAIVIGLFQGVTELVPISSLGHSVLLPDWFGWHNLVKAQSADESFYLAFLVALHVATALALLLHFRATWVRIIRGFFSSARKRSIDTPDERLAWLLVVGTIPVGITGLALEHFLRTVFAKPAAAAQWSAPCRPARSSPRDASSTPSSYAKPASSASPKPLRCSPASVVRASPWSADCCAA